MQEAWQTPSACRTLAFGEVHVWRFALDRPAGIVRQVETWLAADELERANRFSMTRLRDHYVVGRGILRMLLAQYLGRRPAELEFRYGPWGKPDLERPRVIPSIQFNLAHSGPRGLLAVTIGYSIGVDLEHIRPLPDAGDIVSRFFSAAEIAEFLALPERLRLSAFFNGWTRKEAFLKATGSGLANSLDSFDVTLSPCLPPCLLRVAGHPSAARRWSLYHLDPGPGVAGALVVQGAGHQLRFFEAPDPEA